MNNEKTFILDKNKLLVSAQLITLVGISLVAPFFHQQMISGIVVNATLFVAKIILGSQLAIFVGLFPSIIALSIGTLPAPLAPMVPYIMLSNVILIITFSYLKDKNYWLALGIASFLKFLFLFLTSSIVVNL
ncbi:MAG: iron hydrogenase, partial [Candidatus Moranbacteria bacterium]|nr:iron hydrogenase [Candidatus Moranbacteria bacterium]